MRVWLTGCAVLTLLVACQRRSDTDTASGERSRTDTVVTERQLRDTAIIRHDTTVTTDTVRKRGTKPVKTDTVQKP